jgi:hypothetical protein
MKYRQLPLHAELEHLLETQGAEAMEQARSAYALELFRSKGFQIVILLLRELEQTALNKVRTGKGSDRDLGCLNAIEAIRQSLAACLPEPEREKVDFYDDEQESILLDESLNSTGSTE